MDRVKMGGLIGGAILTLIGLVVALQGMGTIPGGMQGEGRWMGLGIAVAIGGVVLAFAFVRGRRRT